MYSGGGRRKVRNSRSSATSQLKAILGHIRSRFLKISTGITAGIKGVLNHAQPKRGFKSPNTTRQTKELGVDINKMKLGHSVLHS